MIKCDDLTVKIVHMESRYKGKHDMKKFLAVLLVLMTTFSLMSCGSPARQKSEETFGEFEWPSSELIDLLPVPESNFGEIRNEGSDFFYVYVGNTTREQYNAYVDACIANGFTVDYDKDEDHYFASNTDGINLYLRYYEDDKYYGKNILDISIDRPEDQENTSTDDPATPSSVASPSLQPTASPTESVEPTVSNNTEEGYLKSDDLPTTWHGKWECTYSEANYFAEGETIIVKEFDNAVIYHDTVGVPMDLNRWFCYDKENQIIHIFNEPPPFDEEWIRDSFEIKKESETELVLTRVDVGQEVRFKKVEDTEN